MTWTDCAPPAFAGEGPMRGFTIVVLVMSSLFALDGCSQLPPGVDRDLTNGWPAMPVATVPVPQSGKCYSELVYSLDWAISLSPVPCAGPHYSETVYVGTFTGTDSAASTAPGAGTPAQVGAFDQCRRNALDYIGGDFMLGRMNLDLALPGPKAWTGGARWFRCEVTRYTNLDNAGEVTEEAGSVRGGLQGARPLALTCATDTANGGGAITAEQVTDCGQPHNAEFAGLFTAPSSPWLADEGRHKLAVDGCEGVAASYLGLPGGKMTNPVLGWLADSFDQDQWMLGNRTVRCFVLGFKGSSPNGIRFTGSVRGIGNRTPK